MRRLSIFSGVACAALVGFTALGCADDDADAGAEITPHLSPIQLVDLWPLGDAEENLGSPERTPYEFVLLLQSTGTSDLVIDDVCLIGDSSNFIIEGPEPDTVRPGEQAGVRLTYNRQSTGSDRVLLGVRSNAENLPVLRVPVCARVISEGSERDTSPPPCEFPEDQIPPDSEICR